MNASPEGRDGLPHVSVVVPVRNGADVLGDCLSAIGAQTYRGPMDVTVALAPSSDGTRRVLAGTSLEVPLQVIDNPTGTTPAGLNLAVAASKGPIVARVDAQSRVPPNYIDRAVRTLASTGAANVGGVQHPVGRDGLQGVIAAAMASSFGGGPAAFRRGHRAGPADTVYLGVFDRDALESLGGFDESLERNQDYELNWRLRQQGHTVWLDPSLVVDYVPRAGYAGLAGQYFSYGTWKRKMLMRHRLSLQIRQLAAPALVAGLAASAVELARGRLRGAALPALYLAACAIAAGRLGRELSGWRDRVRAAGAFMTMHIAWGAGFMAGQARRSQPGERERLEE